MKHFKIVGSVIAKGHQVCVCACVSWLDTSCWRIIGEPDVKWADIHNLTLSLCLLQSATSIKISPTNLTHTHTHWARCWHARLCRWPGLVLEADTGKQRRRTWPCSDPVWTVNPPNPSQACLDPLALSRHLCAVCLLPTAFSGNLQFAATWDYISQLSATKQQALIHCYYIRAGDITLSSLSWSGKAQPHTHTHMQGGGGQGARLVDCRPLGPAALLPLCCCCCLQGGRSGGEVICFPNRQRRGGAPLEKVTRRWLRDSGTCCKDQEGERNGTSPLQMPASAWALGARQQVEDARSFCLVAQGGVSKKKKRNVCFVSAIETERRVCDFHKLWTMRSLTCRPLTLPSKEVRQSIHGRLGSHSGRWRFKLNYSMCGLIQSVWAETCWQVVFSSCAALIWLFYLPIHLH